MPRQPEGGQRPSDDTRSGPNSGQSRVLAGRLAELLVAKSRLDLAVDRGDPTVPLPDVLPLLLAVSRLVVALAPLLDRPDV